MEQLPAEHFNAPLGQEVLDHGDFADLPAVGLEDADLHLDGPQRRCIGRWRRRMTAEERQLAEARSQGQSWEAIAARHHDSPDALRKRLARACDRLVEELGLGE